MPVTLCNALFEVLGVPAGSVLRENILRSASALLGSSDMDAVIPPADGIGEASVSDLLIPLNEEFNAAADQLAALWIAAKFWGVSLQRVSLMSLVTDIIFQLEDSDELDAQREASYDTMEIVHRLCKAEVVLLRRHGYIVPGVSLGAAHA
ncbi:hypothetical protein DQ04_20241010 [Trypanosoma grayi]|uniref:hypothetical protein n=1 Tax=Trypanosoma grayi TaxID=71804 RepID=UPI0004F433D7|nr:hypothetical protein DQ04_20241010 [Trypanosoma grayi]KEG05586.1 hypothetical protein DQ04_20241010 [Trypanosoma grayi]